MRNESGFRVVARVIALVLAVLGLSVMVFGQAETGKITGTVSDATSAVVTAAKITVKNTGTNLTREATTSSAGEYTITNLPAGSYEVTVGSTSLVDARLVVGATGTVLEVVGQAGGTEVDTETQTLGSTITPSQVMNLPSLTRNPYDFVSTSGNVSEGDNGNRGVGVSINGQRSASTNILLDGAENVDLFTAGVGQQVPLDSVQEFKLSTSNFTADYGRASGGVVNVSTKSGTNAFHGSAYEYNRVSALAAPTYQTDAVNYANQQQGLPNVSNSGFVRNQFGYSFGGPVVKNKLFFFSNTEWTRVRSSANNSAYVFTKDFIDQTSSLTQQFWSAYGKLSGGVSNIGVPITASQLTDGTSVSGYQVNPATCPQNSHGVPQCYSPLFVALATENPTLPVLQLVNISVPTDAGAGPPQNSYSSVNRVDFNLTDKTTLWGRYAIQNEIDFPGYVAYSPYNGYNTGQNIRNQNILINLTHIFSPTIVNQAKVSYNRLNNLQPLGAQPPSPSLYMAGSVPTPNNYSVYLPGYLPYSQSNAIPFGGPQNLYQFSDQLSITKGKHSFSLGGEYIQTRDNRIFGAYEEGIADLARSAAGKQATGTSLAAPSSLDQLLSGTIYSYQVAIDPAGTYPCQTDITSDTPINPANCTLNLPVGLPDFGRNNHFNDGAAYGTDSWKIRPRLTLSLGLRWEYFGVQHNANTALDSNFYYPGTLSPASVRAGVVSPAPASPIGALWKQSKKNFGPRIGFAYDVFGNGKTAIRGGYGISYERNFGNVTFNVIQNPPNYAVVSLASSAGYDLPTNNLGPFAGTGTKVLPAVTLRGVDPNIKTAYASFFSLALEHELVRNTVFAVEYSGSRGIHQYSITNVNRYWGGPTYNGDPIVDGSNVINDYQAVRTNTTYGNINFRGSNGDSWYHGVNFRLQSSNFQSKGLQFTFNYTWAHSEDDLSSTFTETQSGEAQGSLGFLDWQHPRFDKGSSDYDIRNRVAFSAVYTPTYLGHFQRKAVQAVAGGWSIAPIWTWHSGTPFTMYDCGYAYGICSRQLNTGGSASYSSITPVDPIGSPNTFSYFTPLPYTPYQATVDGNVVGGGTTDVPSCTAGVCAFPSNMLGRNTYRVPNYYSLNLGIYKTFKLTERMGLQLRGEAYNLFNHSNYFLNYGGTDSEYGSPVTVQKGYNPSTAVYERRNLQLALRLTF
jgi:hypothetical protein